MGACQFERRFRQAVGIPPKLFGGTQRFQRVFAALESAEVRWEDAAVRICSLNGGVVMKGEAMKASGLIAYRVAEGGTSHGQEFAAKVNVSALWIRRGSRWVCVFSQETGASYGR